MDAIRADSCVSTSCLFSTNASTPACSARRRSSAESELIIARERRGDPEPEERVVVDDKNSHNPLLRTHFAHWMAPIRTHSAR
jgi:hypothetical protein